MKYLNSYITLVLVMSLIACNGQQSQQRDSSTSGTEVNAKMSSKPISIVDKIDLEQAILIDVRTPEEFNAGHIQKALNINFFDENFIEQIQELPTDKPLYIYCRSGKRSLNASKALSQLGLEVVNLEGGFNAYSAQH
jgi:phage shock protein E